ncbi:odorant receptor 1a-like [Musca vetustissima]|uniref:odorant receptor 1a-like n=1 Tax=Musca vetustissima TaxID=27455 RepID=UPI002AB7BFD5|nr:odorant receptor 1a-like [Musca vetustissima]
MQNNEARQDLEFLDVQYRALIRVGLDIGAIKGKDFLNNRGKFLIYGSITTYLQYGLILYAVHIFGVEIDKASAALSMFNQGSLLMLKVSILIFKSNRLLKLIWDMNLLATRANEEERETWLSQNRFSKVIGNIYSTACVASVILSISIPIIFMSYENLKGMEVTLKLPFDGEFPYEHLGIPIFILNYILSVIYVYTLLCWTIGIDTLFGWLIHAVSGHFRILRIKVERAARKIDEDSNHEDFVADVGAIVRYHNKTLAFVDALNDIFGQIFWAEVAFSCLQMCFLIFTLNNGSDKRMIPFNAMVFTAISIQMMIYCFGGEKIKTENEMLCSDIYSKFPWEKMRPSEKKMMIFPLQRSQQDAALRGLFFELDRNLLVYIYRTAFSYNTLLGAMKE